MKVFFSLYELKAKRGGFSRSGALLKVGFDGGHEGFADCHPWPELGDASLEGQLALLSQGMLTPLTQQSMVHAAMDAKARTERAHLLADLAFPSSHCLLPSLDEQVPECFSVCKVKLGYDLFAEFARIPSFFSGLPSHCRARFDFNNRIDVEQFRKYQTVLLPYWQQIDFIEDPFPYNAVLWEKIQKESAIRLACDGESENRIGELRSHAVTVLKPAIQNCLELAKTDSHQLVCTSYLDHPIGQMAAAYTAARLANAYPDKTLPCGLLSHLFYQTNKYSETLAVDGDRLIPSFVGTGFGFDQQLSEEQWVQLS